ncbi:hypothetical protein DFJ73DRAFT_865183 [Zopfochytrium polystomum]|nr:hypothetical protein DFJ73DRAFT_865183 [Zopfochytrium polystomum]
MDSSNTKHSSTSSSSTEGGGGGGGVEPANREPLQAPQAQPPQPPQSRSSPSPSPSPTQSQPQSPRTVLVCIRDVLDTTAFDWAASNLLRPGDLCILFHVHSPPPHPRVAAALLAKLRIARHPGDPDRSSSAQYLDALYSDDDGDDDGDAARDTSTQRAADAIVAAFDARWRSRFAVTPASPPDAADPTDADPSDAGPPPPPFHLAAHIHTSPATAVAAAADPRTEICEAAENMGVAAVVVGSGTGPAGRSSSSGGGASITQKRTTRALGSVAAYVVRHCRRPVVVVVNNGAGVE